MARFFVEGETKKQVDAFVQKFGRSVVFRSRSNPTLAIADLVEKELEEASAKSLNLRAAKAYRVIPESLEQDAYRPKLSITKGVPDVISHIRADLVKVDGSGVHIAVVDTGICGDRPEFPAVRRAPAGMNYAVAGEGSPWTDERGHGSMVAGLAAASPAPGRIERGVAPGATLISCKAESFDRSVYDTDLYLIYKHLIGLVKGKIIKHLIINNSYFVVGCDSPSGVQAADLFPKIIQEAINEGIIVVFCAGNSHRSQCQYPESDCGPNSILSVNSLDDVICVGTVDENNDLHQLVNGYPSHADSSRGIGEFAQRTIKPDCVAPGYGLVFWGCDYRRLDCWGTSGAAGLVSGLAALMLSKNGKLTPRQIQDAITATCRNPNNRPRTCVGAGVIDCKAAVDSV